MRLIQIALASPNPTVGAVRSNTEQMLGMAREMAAAGVTLGCFTEQCIGGYPPEDLIQFRAFVDAQWAELERFAVETAELPTVFVTGVAASLGGRIFNCAAVVHGGRILGVIPKEKLPTYNVFYEARTFSRGAPGLALEVNGVPFGDYVFAFDFLLIAWRAAQLLEGCTITAFYMPSRFSGEETRSAAAALCRELGVELRVVPIDEAFDRETEAVERMLSGEPPTEITRQNIQARLRASRMWNWANSAGALFLQTGDMSEKAVGYTTIGGDLEGALSVIANVPKTVVVALLERFHQRFGAAYGLTGVAQTLATAPGPELAAAQEAEAELMPFPVLDACLHLYAGEKLSPDEVAIALRSLFPEHAAERLAAWADRFAVLFTRSIYKWVQSPLSLHVGSLDLDRERALQLPVVQRNEWGRGMA